MRNSPKSRIRQGPLVVAKLQVWNPKNPWLHPLKYVSKLVTYLFHLSTILLSGYQSFRAYRVSSCTLGFSYFGKKIFAKFCKFFPVIQVIQICFRQVQKILVQREKLFWCLKNKAADCLVTSESQESHVHLCLFHLLVHIFLSMFNILWTHSKNIERSQKYFNMVKKYFN